MEKSILKLRISLLGRRIINHKNILSIGIGVKLLPQKWYPDSNLAAHIKPLRYVFKVLLNYCKITLMEHNTIWQLVSKKGSSSVWKATQEDFMHNRGRE